MPVQQVTQLPPFQDSIQWTGENEAEILALYPSGEPYVGSNEWYAVPQVNGTLKLGQDNSGGHVYVPEGGWILSSAYWVKNPAMQYWDRANVSDTEYQARFAPVVE